MYNETYEWEIECGPYGLVHVSGFSSTVSTPSLGWNPNDTTKIKWKLTVRSVCGETIRQGQAIYPPYRKPLPGPPFTSEGEPLQDGLTSYVRAEITDPVAYEAAIDKRVSQTMFPPEATDEDIVASIEKIRMDELHPYILDSFEALPILAKMAPNDLLNEQGETPISKVKRLISISPNPAKEVLYLDLSGLKVPEQTILISIIDLYGRQVQSLEAEISNKVPVLIDNLPAGTYFLKVLLSSGQEAIRFVKE